MPRIDPQQLLNCLHVLLTPSGGILSIDEVQRLANLMTKFSKKLVSKCIYVLILKNTDKQLLGAFMAEGGWNLIHLWLQDANLNKNWALVTEVLELLLTTPVDVERLKMNNLPKLIKSLSKREDLGGVHQLATTLVEEWLKIVKDVTRAEIANQPIESKEVASLVVEDQNVEPMEVDENVQNETNNISANLNTDNTLRFKLALKDKQVISKLVPVISIEENVPAINSDVINVNGVVNNDQVKKEKDEKKSNHDKKHKSSSSSKSSSSRDKERSSRDKSSSSSSRSSRDKEKDKKDKHRSNGSSKHKSSSSSSKSSSSNRDREKDKKETKEKQAEKDKDTLAKIQPQTLQKLGRIPKKNEEKSKTKKDDTKKEETKKPTFSVEVRKTTEEKPKTVKIFNSKMRSTGLLEEAKPPPPRTTVKKPLPTLPAVLPTKRSSPIRDLIPPPEKKSRLLEPTERPGAIKLIPPKPKPAVLQESDIFMDALTASATTKKEPKKRKRRASVSKEASPPHSPATTTPTPSSPTTNLKNITPANFYQDTLETENEDEKDKENQSEDKNVVVADTPAEPTEEAVTETTRTDANGLKGVLSYSKRKGPKRSLRWRPDTELVEIQYFELDETERVNVMKPFMDMARMEMSSEREALRARKLPNEDVMDSQISWRLLIELDLPAPQAEIGSKSLEKDIQFAREKQVLQAIYFNNRIPDTPSEPENEIHQMVNAIVIPLDDPDNPEQDNPVQPWPEPKGSPPHVPNVPPMFPNIPGPPFIGMPGPPTGFPPNGIPPFNPGFIPPNILGRPPGDWNGIPNGLPPPNMPPPDMMNQVPPNMFDGFGPSMQDNNFPPPFAPPSNNMPMFPQNNFNNNNMRGRGGFRRGSNGGPWLRMAAPNQGWNGRGGGGPNRGGGRFCINVKKHGYCRNRDNCPFVHPN